VHAPCVVQATSRLLGQPSTPQGDWLMVVYRGHDRRMTAPCCGPPPVRAPAQPKSLSSCAGACCTHPWCRWGPMESELRVLQGAADWKEAEATGRVVPAEVGGVLMPPSCGYRCRGIDTNLSPPPGWVGVDALGMAACWWAAWPRVGVQGSIRQAGIDPVGACCRCRLLWGGAAAPALTPPRP
jgi:hypothetical protein